MFDLMMMAKLIHIYFSGSLNMHRICSNSCIYYEIVLLVNYVKKLVLSIVIDVLLLQFLTVIRPYPFIQDLFHSLESFRCCKLLQTLMVNYAHCGHYGGEVSVFQLT